MTGLNELVITELERLLERKLSAEEVRLVLLASMVEERLLDNETGHYESRRRKLARHMS